jgi:DNA-3-methyladenine glycosylase II
MNAADIAAIRAKLCTLDPALAHAHAVTPPFDWRVWEGGYRGLVKIIVGQQVSVAAADAIWARLEAGLSGVSAKAVLDQDVEGLKRFGLSAPKARYALAIAAAEKTGEIDFAALPALDDETAMAALVALKGVGRWTAEIYLMFCEGRLDFFPAGDLALQEGLRLADGAAERPAVVALYQRAEAWRPHRGVAAHLLWAYYGGVKRGEIVHSPKDGAANAAGVLETSRN